MAEAKTPGDGKTSPFGNGSGKGTNTGASTMANSTAGANPGKNGNNFLTNPSGNSPAGAKPTDFTRAKVATQKSGPNCDINAQSAIKDKGQLVPLADVTSGPRKEMVGAGSIGDSRKPFKL
jgi:hypothetical protein